MGDLGGVLIRRVLSGVVALILLVTGVFLVTRVMGDPVAGLAGEDATPERRAAIRERLGLDRPLPEQYFTYMSNVSRGDFGDSYRLSRPAMELIVERLPATLTLSALSMILGIVVAIPVGVISAIRPGSLLDSIGRTFSVLGQSVPLFWLGILLIIVFAVNLQILPAGGRESWQSLILPASTLAFASLPLTMRITRSAMLEVLNKDYVRTARAKGLREWRVITGHVLRNALIPVITVLALRLGNVVSGSVVLEEVFGYPGVGRVAVQALRSYDFPLIQAFIVMVGASIIIINLLADILYTVVDPRVRLN